MLEPILGSVGAERVLVFLYARKKGYAREISRYYECSLAPIQKQLARLELGGVLVSQSVGRTLVYELNPRYAFRRELEALLQKAIDCYKPDEKERLVMVRRRPRRRGKPL